MISDDTRRQARRLDYLRLAFSVAAIALIVYGLVTMRQTSRSRGWLPVDGRVVASNVNQFSGRNGVTYRPMIIFSYAVGPSRFMSSRVSFQPFVTSNRDAAATVAARYPVGKTVQVFYDPQDPEQAVLDRGPNPWLFIVSGGVLAMAAVAVRMRRANVEKGSR